MSKGWVVVGLLAMGAGCAENRSLQERGGIITHSAPMYRAPEKSRCAKFRRGQTASEACGEARYLAEGYVRKLSPGDEVCLDGGFGDVAGAACKARGVVSDTGTGRVLITVRDPKPDSKWFQEERNQFWFEEGALVDLYLQDHGY